MGIGLAILAIIGVSTVDEVEPRMNTPMIEFTDCVKAAVKNLDDQLSDAETVAAAVLATCDQQYAKFEEDHKREILRSVNSNPTLDSERKSSIFEELKAQIIPEFRSKMRGLVIANILRNRRKAIDAQNH